MKEKVFFICVNYNNSEYTNNYIDSVLNLKDLPKNTEIIIVDNKSENEDIERIKNHISNKPNVKLIENNKNLGYFGGLNEGLKKIKNEVKRYVILGNNDIKFNNDFYQKLMEVELNDKLMVICPDVLTSDGVHQNPHLIKKISKLKKLKNEIYYKNYYMTKTLIFINKFIKKLLNKEIANHKNFFINKKMKIRMGIGACYVLTPNFFKYFDLLNNEVFMWGEEAVFANQIESVMGEVMYIPDLKVFHEESVTVKNLNSKKRFYMVKDSYKKYKKYL